MKIPQVCQAREGITDLKIFMYAVHNGVAWNWHWRHSQCVSRNPAYSRFLLIPSGACLSWYIRGTHITTSQLVIGTLTEHVSLSDSLYISFLYNKLTQETCISLSLS